MASRNPDPVVVGLVLPESERLLLIRRSIKPFIGELALPGGYVKRGEDWREALQREIEEEASVIVSTKPEHMKVYDVRSTPDGQKLLIFAMINQEGVKQVRPFKINREVSERIIVPFHHYSSAPEMCFPLHNEVVKKYQKEHYTHEDAHPGGW